MKKLQQLLTAVVLLCCIYPVNTLSAQKATAKDSLPAQRVFEVNADLLWLIDKNTVPASSLMFRYYLPSKGNTTTALRMRIGADMDYHTVYGIALSQPLDSTLFVSPYLSVGFQKSKTYKKGEGFWGIDVAGTYTHKNIINTETELGDIITFQFKINEKKLAISPFLGYSYRINDNISVSVESHFDAMITKYHLEEFYTVNKTPTLMVANDRIFHFTTGFQPIQTINLCYSFTQKKKI